MALMNAAAITDHYSPNLHVFAMYSPDRMISGALAMRHLKAWANGIAVAVAMGIGVWLVLGAIYFFLFRSLGFEGVIRIAAIFAAALLIIFVARPWSRVGIDVAPRLSTKIDIAPSTQQSRASISMETSHRKETSLLAELLALAKLISAPPELSAHGSILWNPPRHMRVNRRERVEVRLGDARVAMVALGEGLKGRGCVLTDHLEIAPRMRVAVTSDPSDFTVQTLSSQEQLIRPGMVARWDFDVTALRGGRRRLRLLASMRVKVEGNDEVVDLPAYESEIRVSVAPLHSVGVFLVENWKWVAGTIILPLFGWAALQSGVAPDIAKWLRIETGHRESPPLSVPARPVAPPVAPPDTHAGSRGLAQSRQVMFPACS